MDINPQLTVKLGILVIALCAAVSGQSCPPGDDWDTYNGRCFLFKVEQSKDHKTWHEALKACKGYNGGRASLVSIHNREENDFIEETARAKMGDDKMHLWIGMSKKAYGYPYLWEDGSDVDYVYWDEGEPNDLDGSQPCCRMFESNGMWDDFDCKAETEWEEYHGYICQADPALGGNTNCQDIPQGGYPGCCTTGDVFAIIFGLIILAGIVCAVLGYLYVFKWDKQLPWQQTAATTATPSSNSAFDNPDFAKTP